MNTDWIGDPIFPVKTFVDGDHLRSVNSLFTALGLPLAARNGAERGGEEVDERKLSRHSQHVWRERHPSAPIRIWGNM